MQSIYHLPCICIRVIGSCVYIIEACFRDHVLKRSPPLPPQIAGFVNAVRPLADDTANLTAFRFHALNPIVDPWVFIICRKAVFRHLYALLSCRFKGGGAVKSAAPPSHRAVSVVRPQPNPAGVPDPAGQPLHGYPVTPP